MLIEVLVAMVILTVAILGLILAFNSSRKLSLASERHTSMAHRAQLEIERLQATPYSELTMIEAPKHETSKENPDYNVNSSPTTCTSAGDGCYAWNAEKTTEEAPLIPAIAAVECTSTVTTKCGAISVTPSSSRKCLEHVGACEWKDESFSGNVYDFVTWYEPTCITEEKLCPKRLTVVVTLTPSGSVAPMRVSTLIT
ncbi:MAG: type IV pilus modification PilV family protein [Solirubrobacteraceae bacterium]